MRGSKYPSEQVRQPAIAIISTDKGINGWSIPGSSELRENYLFDVYKMDRKELKEKLKG